MKLTHHLPSLMSLAVLASCSFMIDSSPEGLTDLTQTEALPDISTAGVVAGATMVESAGVTAGAVETAGVTAGSGDIGGVELSAGVTLNAGLEAPLGAEESAGVEVEIAGDEPPVAGVVIDVNGGQLAGGAEPTCLPMNELCNGRDDDCDEQVDEDFDVGAPCTVGVGECVSMGALNCSADGVGISCVGTPADPTQELCDALDNDCDGVSDEEVVGCCTQGDVRSCGSAVGLCTLGEQRCVNEQWDECDGASAVAERCDGEDNDCDGRTDEGTLNACSACGPVPSESCNGVDDDCDGSTDETFPQLGGSCAVGVGACRSSGSYVCDGPSDIRCTASAGSPSATDPCNDVDDDCDGRVDEDTDLLSDYDNCGSCGFRCGTLGDRCINGLCQCGTSPACCTGAPNRAQCIASTTCSGGSCVAECNGELCK